MEPGTILLIIGLALLAILVILALVVLVRTLTFSSPKKQTEPITLAEIDGLSVAEHLGRAVQFKTIAYQDQSKIDPKSFEGFHRLLKALYPEVHEHLKREVINKYSLLYTWLGSNPELDPIMLTSHIDVVPADESKDSGWTHPPFSGIIEDGFVWGRGTMDCKYGIIGILEAVTNLLKTGYTPERTIFLGFGHDEEVSGIYGAKAMADTLEARGVHLACLIDEGGSVTQGLLQGVIIPAGLIGISEKGAISLKLSTHTIGGHSAMPPANTSIGMLSLAIAALEADQFPAHLEVITFLMGYFGKYLPFVQRMAFANTWLFGRMLKRKLSRSYTTNAIIRTTTAPTIFHSGHTENVLPADAEAVVNFRILPGDTLRSVYERVVAVVDDERIAISPYHADTLESDYGWDPTPVADTDSPEFIELTSLIEAVFPGSVAAPYLMLGATDARHYARICQNTFRFSPRVITGDELKCEHGMNERLSFENCARMVAFYMAYIERMAGSASELLPDLVE
jgi:carboxypeptidase PM20D1